MAKVIGPREAALRAQTEARVNGQAARPAPPAIPRAKPDQLKARKAPAKSAAKKKAAKKKKAKR